MLALIHIYTSQRRIRKQPSTDHHMARLRIEMCIRDRLSLAPMEGLTGYVFRRVHAECFGALDRYYTPFLPVSYTHLDVYKRQCGKCSRVCQMDVDVVRAPNHAECIRCGKCIGACPVDAISYRYGLDVSAEKLPLTADKK